MGLWNGCMRVTLRHRELKCFFRAAIIVLSPFVDKRKKTSVKMDLILPNKVWEHLTDQQKEALVFHELCHVEASVDKNRAPRNSSNDGRPVFRLCSHDLEEFKLVVEKYGLWRPDAQDFMVSAKKGEQLTMDFPQQNPKKAPSSNVIHLRAK
ncbi:MULTISPECIES: putative metallopeptidase [Paenibacillus]|uniref:putative metallopeptidase n=1 Tax=Paenibacillus TaxID=44249 RepID=UPI00203C61C7|nr:putative metallopeptidase [Paenibacillus polysaccharolyticus]MCM3132231.1 hypothetical protein [Paenibacillus polysaccharolyticus]